MTPTNVSRSFRHHWFCLFLVGLLLSLASVSSVRAERLFGSEKAGRVVILGGTFAERLQYFGYFETLLSRHESGRDLIVRNMGWPGDEVALMPRPYNFIISAGTGVEDDPNPGYGFSFTADADHRILIEHLKAQKPDSILLCFGANESFKGKEGLEKFASDYQQLIDQLLGEKFNGETVPRLVVVSPIAQEKLGAPYSDPEERNQNLKLYSEKIADIATGNDLVYVDLFTPTLGRMGQSQDKPLTIDGLQLNAHGQRIVAEALATELGMTEPWSQDLEPLRKLVVEKNKQFQYRWRPINGEYVYGRRREPFGVVSYPPEMAQLDKIIVGLEEKIHAKAKQLSK